MAYLINEDCINCGACEPECPNSAINESGAGDQHPNFSDEHFHINPSVCTECKGQNDEPQCVSVCPVDAVKHID
jgi:ferredoxin